MEPASRAAQRPLGWTQPRSRCMSSFSSNNKKFIRHAEGKRIGGGLLLAIASCIFIAIQIQQSVATVVGIDLGTEMVKVAVALPGRPIEMLLNGHSKRKTPAAVSFIGNTRDFGDNALNRRLREPSDVITGFTKLVSMDRNSKNGFRDFVDKYNPLNVVWNKDHNVSMIHLKQQNMDLHPQEFLAHFFEWIAKTVGEFQGLHKTPKLDAVITIPESFSMRERLMVFEAAAISSHMNLLGLIRTPAAAALQHALGLELQPNHSISKLIIDHGAWMTQACVAKFSRHASKNKPTPRVHILGCSSSSKIGGRHFDVVLADYLLKTGEEKLGIDLKHSEKVLQRIFEQANKAKHALSANKEIAISLDSFPTAPDSEVSIHVSRTDFEKMISPQLSVELSGIVSEALKKSSMDLKSLDGVELVGAAWRVPLVQQQLEKVLAPFELGQHINGDEAAALAAAVVAANASSTFRVRELHFGESAGRNVVMQLRNSTNSARSKSSWSLSWSNGPSFQTFEVLAPGALWRTHPYLVKHHFRTCSDVEAMLVERADASDKIPITLGHYIITGIESACKGNYTALGSPKITISTAVTPVGLVSINTAIAEFEEPYTEMVPKTTTTTTVTMSPTGSHNISDVPAPNDAGATQSSSLDATNNNEEGSDPKGAPRRELAPENGSDKIDPKVNVTGNAAEPEMELVHRVRKHLVSLNTTVIDESLRRLSSEERMAARSRLQQFEENDHSAARLAEARNSLESLVYSSRKQLQESEAIKVSHERQREAIQTLLAETEDWLYEGTTAGIELYLEKTKIIQEFIAPLLMRRNELRGRAVFKRDQLPKVSADLASLQNLLESGKFDVEQSLLDTLTGAWSKFQKWFSEVEAKQAELELTSDPAYKIEEATLALHDISGKIDIVRRSLTSKSAPAKTPSKGAEESEEAGGESGGSDGGQATKASTDNSNEASTDTAVPLPPPPGDYKDEL